MHSRVCHWCPYHNLTSPVMFHSTEPWQHKMFLYDVIEAKLLLLVTLSMRLFSAIDHS